VGLAISLYRNGKYLRTWIGLPIDTEQQSALDWATRPFAGSRIGPGPLTTQRQTTPVTDTPVAAKIHQALDIHRHFTTKIALDTEFRHFGTEALHFFFRQVLKLCGLGDTGRGANLAGPGATNAVDRRQGNDSVFPVGDIDTGNTGHVRLTPSPQKDVPRTGTAHFNNMPNQVNAK
jgi:hypothetical protein